MQAEGEMVTRAGCEEHLQMSTDEGVQPKPSDSEKRLDLKMGGSSRGDEVGLTL